MGEYVKVRRTQSVGALQSMETKSIKEAARQLVEQLPENSTWDDLMNQIYVRQAIELGLADSEAGRIISVEQVRAQFGLPE
jgi:predicted transcriptional regulator